MLGSGQRGAATNAAGSRFVAVSRACPTMERMIVSSHGDTVISLNSDGALCLNSAMALADVDEELEWPLRGCFFGHRGAPRIRFTVRQSRPVQFAVWAPHRSAAARLVAEADGA
jgi:hypothetical protein